MRAILHFLDDLGQIRNRSHIFRCLLYDDRLALFLVFQFFPQLFLVHLSHVHIAQDFLLCVFEHDFLDVVVAGGALGLVVGLGREKTFFFLGLFENIQRIRLDPVFEVAEEIFGDPRDLVHIFCDGFGVQIVDRMPGVLQKDEVELIIAVVAMLENAFELILARQSLWKLRIIFIKQVDYLL